jgi:hypothetical protein
MDFRECLAVVLGKKSTSHEMPPSKSLNKISDLGLKFAVKVHF